VAFALLLLLARIAINSHALRRLQVADGFATLAFALLAINGVCCLAVVENGGRPSTSLGIGVEASAMLITQCTGCHDCHVLINVRTPSRQRWPRATNSGIPPKSLILPQMPIRVHDSLLGLLVECQRLVSGILLPAYRASDLAAPSMVGDRHDHCAGFRGDRHLVPFVVHVFYPW
jgi:hypothetical protein